MRCCSGSVAGSAHRTWVGACTGPSGGGFNKGVTERVMAALPIRWPGVRYRLVHDAAAGAEHVAVLTKVLANQPYVNQVLTLPTCCSCRRAPVCSVSDDGGT